MTLAWSSETATLTDREPVTPAIGRWTVALLVVAGFHVAAVMLALTWRMSVPPIEMPPPAIMIDLPPMPVPLPAPVPPPPPVFPKPPEPEPELIKEPEPEIVPPKPEVVLPPKPKPKPIQKKVEAPPQPELPPLPAAPPRPPEPVAAPPMPVATPSVAPSYEGIITAHLLRHKRYPREARMRGQQGVASVRFVLDREGKLLSFSLARTSGQRLLDEEVLATIQRAAPMPPFPPEMTQGQIELIVPIRFELK